MKNFGCIAGVLVAMICQPLFAADPPADGERPADQAASNDSKAVIETPAKEQSWNLHLQNTNIVQYHPNFSALYSGLNSLQNTADVRETITFDITAGVHLWKGGEAFIDGFMYQGFGFNNTVGTAGFPNGDSTVGTDAPAVALARLFIRQTFSFGGEQQCVNDDQTHLGGQVDGSRLVINAGKFGAKDFFDSNAYANDPRSQFMNQSLTANGAWDFAQDALGSTTGIVVELYQPKWVLRYGFLQVARDAGGMTEDAHYLKAWQMVAEIERGYTLLDRPGVIRLLGYASRADMGKYQDALNDPVDPKDIVDTRRFRIKYGVGLNVEQEICKDVGAFLRLGWNDGRTESWSFTDVDRTASLGVSVKGSYWGRPDDTYGLAGVVNGISSVHRDFIAAGGTGLQIGDGRLSYGPESIFETYYDFKVWQTVHFALDYQFINNPAYNRDRGPVCVYGARLHWDF